MQIIPQIDLHSHILPTLDDGARSLEESVAMAQRAAGAGICRIVAAPHVRDLGRPAIAGYASQVRASTGELRAALQRAEVDIDVVPGAEIRLSAELVAQVPRAPWLTIAGCQRYVLVMVEAPFRRWPSYVAELIFRLTVHQVVPIVVHPERLRLVQRDPRVLLEPVERGARVQLTASSLARTSPRPVRRCAGELLRLGIVSFIASDAHRAQDLLPGEVVSAVVAAVGEAEAYRILVENPRLVLAGRPVPMPAQGEAAAPLVRCRRVGR